MNDLLKTFIKMYEAPMDFTHASFHPEDIAIAESGLGVTLPEEYIAFLKEFGHGGINGIETIGIGKNGRLLFEKETLKYRKYGLPHDLIVIENCGEWFYCLNADNENVVMWSRGEQDTAYRSFDDYLQDRTSEATDNL